MSELTSRSEILFLTDAQDCNPNGNPLANNRPRRDPETGQGIITDVRLKRYLRDQLLADGYDIYIKRIGGESQTRTTLALDVLGDGIEDADDIDDIEDVGKRFLRHATDVRYFGATLSFESRQSDEDEQLQTALQGSFPTQYQGPVQFLPAKSLNVVEENEEFDSLTSVVGTSEGNRQGGFDLDDHRILYGIFPFYGIVDESSADNTHLSVEDVERLDTLCWRALKNQTNSRSKFGQSPRLYLRVEYKTEHFHIGGLQNLVSLSDESDRPLRSITDIVIDVSELISTLSERADPIKKVHVVGDSRLSLVNNNQIDDELDRRFNAGELSQRLDDLSFQTHNIDVYGERDLA